MDHWYKRPGVSACVTFVKRRVTNPHLVRKAVWLIYIGLCRMAKNWKSKERTVLQSFAYL